MRQENELSRENGWDVMGGEANCQNPKRLDLMLASALLPPTKPDTS